MRERESGGVVRGGGVGGDEAGEDRDVCVFWGRGQKSKACVGMGMDE